MADMHLNPDPFGKDSKKKSTRDGFGRALEDLGDEDPNVWALSADVSESSRTHWFAQKHPERFVQVGVCEQNMAGVAAGIASCGKTVFISAFGAFSPGRNFDQIRVSVCYNGSDVKIHASHCGLSVGPDGASHQILEDIAMMRALPGMVVIVPSDFEQARKATLAAGRRKGPAYIRTSRESSPLITTDKTPFEIGKANVYREGKDAAVFACGLQVAEALKAAKTLEGEGIDVAVIDMHTIKPIDKETIIRLAESCQALVSAEDHQVDGGLGSAIAEVLSSPDAVKRIVKAKSLSRVGMKDSFGESGNTAELYRKYGVDARAIEDALRAAIGRL